jgi:hypothetical protein
MFAGCLIYECCVNYLQELFDLSASENNSRLMEVSAVCRSIIERQVPDEATYVLSTDLNFLFHVCMCVYMYSTY